MRKGSEQRVIFNGEKHSLKVLSKLIKEEPSINCCPSVYLYIKSISSSSHCDIYI